MSNFKSFNEWFKSLEQGVNETWFGEPAVAVKEFGSAYEEYVRSVIGNVGC